jgi:aminomethyltransferase
MTLHRTPFHDLHTQLGATMVEFAGWEMPLRYGKVVEEHERCRTSGGFFDVSHMGRLRFEGPDAAAFLALATTRDPAVLTPGQSRYALVCRADGGVMDDVIVARFATHYGMVCNASNREKLLAHFANLATQHGLDAGLRDVTDETAMAALQGPKVMDEIAPLLLEPLGVDVRELKRFGHATGEFMGFEASVYRSGYTGEDGVEIVLPKEAASMAAGMAAGFLTNGPIYACGLAARDTLRVEAGLPLYGHELDETIDPASAGLAWCVRAEGDFVGSGPVRQAMADGPPRKLVGLELDSRRTARQGQPVMVDRVEVGRVTSGCLSPTLGKSIAMALVASEFANVGQQLGVDFKREIALAKVVPTPFYRRPNR